MDPDPKPNPDHEFARERQFRDIRSQMHLRGAMLLFAGNGAVAAAIVQWLLREPAAQTWCSFAIHIAALIAAGVHAFGAWRAIDAPRVWLHQFWKDQKNGIEDPSTAAPMRALTTSGRCFVVAIAILVAAVLLRELGLP